MKTKVSLDSQVEHFSPRGVSGQAGASRQAAGCISGRQAAGCITGRQLLSGRLQYSLNMYHFHNLEEA